MDKFTSLVETILDFQKKKGSAFVAISGLGGSGKTTLTNQLEKTIPDANIIYVDHFYKPQEERGEDHSSESVISNCFDWNRMETILRLFQEGKPVCYQAYDLFKNVWGGWTEMQPKSITILEGLYCLQERFLPYYDLSIWVDAPRDVRLKRIQKRDLEWKHAWHQIWMDQDDRYLAVEKPHEKAHIIYPNV